MLSHFILTEIPVSMNYYSQFTGEELSSKGIKQLGCGYTMMELEFKPSYFYPKSDVPIRTAFQVVECSHNEKCGFC